MTSPRDSAPPCKKCAHYRHVPAADPINRDICMIGPVNARYQRDTNCFGNWFVWCEPIQWTTPKTATKKRSTKKKRR